MDGFAPRALHVPSFERHNRPFVYQYLFICFCIFEFDYILVVLAPIQRGLICLYPLFPSCTGLILFYVISCPEFFIAGYENDVGDDHKNAITLVSKEEKIV